jgi:hypothetical protein
MAPIDKARVLEALRAQIDSALATLIDSQKRTQSGATHEETRAEDPKDTQAIEAGYLARGLAQRAEQLRDDSDRLRTLRLAVFGEDDPIAATALVCLEDAQGEQSYVFLTPAGAGERIDVDGVTVRPITAASPLGTALLGACTGDDVDVLLPGGTQVLHVVSVS